ncbi:MAG: hypothetical protein V4449_03000 [Patescibacteria group bacterium]
MKNLYKRLFDYSENIQFECVVSMEEALKRLAEKLQKQSVFIFLTSTVSHPSLMGQITKNSVKLHRVVPFLGNIYKPIFYGRFNNKNGKIVLEGMFTMSPIAKISTLLFLTIFVAIEIIMLPVGFAQADPSAILLLFAIPIIAFLPVCFLFLGRRLARNDMEWISNHIKSTLA